MTDTATPSLRSLLLVPLALALLVGSGCGGKRVERVGTDTDIDLSGEWNDADSRRVAEQMVDSILADPWYREFQARHDRDPVVRVGSVRVRTDGDVVNTEIFTNELRKAMIRSREIAVVSSRDEATETRMEVAESQVHASEETKKEAKQETAADFILYGTIGVQNDQEGRRQVRYYQVDLTLADVETRKQVWLDNTRIKKYVTW